jgi:hypothetical protein
VKFESKLTIAVALKVRDGVVLAADSATTLVGSNGVENIYNHANKIVNLRKGLPIGFMTWGLGGFGSASVASLAKDFRAKFDEVVDSPHNVEEVANEFHKFLEPLYHQAVDQITDPPAFGCLIAGHSVGNSIGECWVIESDGAGSLKAAVEQIPGDEGVVWYGQPRWIQRLVLGFDVDGVANALTNSFGVSPADLPSAIATLRQYTQEPMVHPAMPIQDAINLARFLVDLTVQGVQFAPGAPTVGGPIEIAAITKHEGFRWISRKHYFDARLNT